MRNIWKTTVVCVFILTTMLLSSVNTMQNNRGASKETGFIEVRLEAGNYTVKHLGCYSKIVMEGFGSTLTPGYPMLPSKTFLVGLPPNTEVTTIDIVEASHKILPGSHRIPLASSPLSDWEQHENKGEKHWFDTIYPPHLYEYLGMGEIRKHVFARIRFNPIAYFPATGKLIMYRNITLRISYRVAEERLDEMMLTDNVMDETVSKLIVNYPQIAHLYTSAAKPMNLPVYNYVVVTKNSLKDAVKPLVIWKESLGYNVKIVTNYTTPEEIRGFLKNKYVEWGIKYVLIVGSTHSIPMKRCYPKPNDPDKVTPTDYYYADLTGDWNSDYDNYYGERGEDDVDFYPEVYVGRIPFDDPWTVKNICKRIVEYESRPWEWKKNVLLLGAIILYENENGVEQPKTDGATGMEECRVDIFNPNGYICTTMYEKNGLNPSEYSCNQPLTHENVLREWKKGYGVVNWWAHGTVRFSSRKIWGNDDGDNIPEGDEMDWHRFIESTDTPGLNHEKPSVVFSCSCSTAWPEEKESLGNSLMKNAAVAFIGATRTSWSTVGWRDELDGGNMAINYYFLNNLLTHGQGIGEALYNSKVKYINYFNWWGWKNYQDMYGFNLYGDPSMVMELLNYPPSPPSNPTPTDDAKEVDPNITLTWEECNDPEGDRVYYDVYLSEDEEPGENNLVASNLTQPSYNPMLKENTHYLWKVVARDEKGLSRESPTWGFSTIDTVPPTVEIITPKEGYIYVTGEEKKQTLLKKTIILGWVEVKVHVDDNMGLEKVCFYVNKKLRHTCYVYPYSWRWDETVFGRYILKTVAYDQAGNTATDEIKVMVFNIRI